MLVYVGLKWGGSSWAGQIGCGACQASELFAVLRVLREGELGGEIACGGVESQDWWSSHDCLWSWYKVSKI